MAGRPRKPPGEKASPITVRLFASDIERLRWLSETTGYSQADVVRRAILAIYMASRAEGQNAKKPHPEG